MGHSGRQNEKKFTADVFIQHHRAVQPLTGILSLVKRPFGPQTACTDYHCA